MTDGAAIAKACGDGVPRGGNRPVVASCAASLAMAARGGRAGGRGGRDRRRMPAVKPTWSCRTSAVTFSAASTATRCSRRAGRLRARAGLRAGDHTAAQEPAGAPVDARDLGADLRDVQDLSDPAGQVPADPRGLHRDDHRVLLRRAAALPLTKVAIILLFSLVGIAGSYGVAWFGIRVNTYANSRTAFAALQGKPYPVLRDSAQGGHEHRDAAHQRRAGDHARSSCCSFPATTPARASSASRSASRSARRRCASRAASSRRSPTSAPTS